VTARSVARQYANAAFAVAQRNQHVEVFGRELQDFASLVTSHPDLRKALESAGVPKQAKQGLIAALLDRAAPVSAELRRLLDLLTDNGRLSLVPAIAAAYDARVLEAAGVVTAELVTALPLDDHRQALLAKALGQVTGRRVDVTGRVDEAIIGGVIARVGGTVYDGSVSRQLERMRQRLTAEA
jgi:F-type H+-transporting ATPase subunit delta